MKKPAKKSTRTTARRPAKSFARKSTPEKFAPTEKPGGEKFTFFKLIFTAPVIIYAALLILAPIVYILFISFLKRGTYGELVYEPTLENYLDIFDPTFLGILLRSVGIGLLATLICLLISYPFAIALRKKSPKTQNLISKLIMVPFLTNSLIRTYAWVTLLRKNGVINSALIATGLISTPLNLMYNNLGVVIGMVYTLLPFMLLPLIAAVQKVDQNLLDAASDLGAGPLKKFFKVYVPLTISGAFNGCIMVFTPAIGYFFIADILGGGKAMIIGNLIKNQFLTARNWPLGAALSIFLLLLTYLIIQIYKRLGGNMDELGNS